MIAIPFFKRGEAGKPAIQKDEEIAHAQRMAADAHGNDEYVRRHRLYARATRLLAWGEVQAPRHAAPHDILIDLIQVTACFQIGHFLSHNLGERIGVLGLCALGLTTINTWSDLLAYRSRFESVSFYHSLLDSLQALFFAAAAHNIISDLEVFEQRHMHAFILFTLASRTVSLVRLLELALKGEEDERGNAKASARDMLGCTLAEMATVSLAFYAVDAASFCYVLLAAASVEVAWTVGPSVLGQSIPAEKRVPVHVEFIIARTGELVMLALGETVLVLVLALSQVDVRLIAQHNRAHGHQELGEEAWLSEPEHGHAGAEHATVTVDAAVHAAEHAAHTHLRGEHVALIKLRARALWSSVGPDRDLAFVSAFALVSAIIYIYGHVNPQHRHRHATRRSLTRGLIWSYSHWPLVVAIIGLSASIKELFRLSSEAVPLGTAILLAGSLGVVLLVLSLQLVLHPGWPAYALASVGRLRRLSLFAARALMCALLMLLAPILVLFDLEVELSGFQWLLCAGATTLLTAILLALEKSGGESDRALWAYADALLTGKTPAEVLAREAEKVLADENETHAQRRGSMLNNPFASRKASKDSTDGGNGPHKAEGCVPCVPLRSKPKDKSVKWNQSLSAAQWQRLG